MAQDASAPDPVTTIGPGEARKVLARDGSRLSSQRPALAIVATQEESTDDGGSQSALGILEVGGPVTVRAEFDIREGTVIRVPAAPFSVTVKNVNDDNDPAITVSWFFLDSLNANENTRSYDLWSEVDGPNFRVPPFAHSFVYDLGLLEATDYKAFLSDSPTGETYGYAVPGVRYALASRTRWVRFMNLPSDTMGSIIFFLSI